ncbi:MAG TPA: hypothetical protein VK563_19155 [Puia sp.]|nr:hypothetical protein [Puia sp.]
MKKISFFFSFICLAVTALCQDQAPSYDSSFKALYKAVALHPGHRNSEGVIHDSVVRKWDKDIVIRLEGGAGKSRKEILGKLRNTIALISPALDSKIKISFTDDKASANYFIDLDYIGRRSGWYLKWDALDNIYSCRMLVNTRIIFNRDQQAALVSHYFLQSLGDFIFNQKDRSDFIKNDPSAASNMSLWRQDINNIDLQILRLHYTSDIKPGMAKKDIDQYFDRHGR